MRLTLFLLLSAAAHAGIFWPSATAWHWPAQERRAHALHVELDDAAALRPLGRATTISASSQRARPRPSAAGTGAIGRATEPTMTSPLISAEELPARKTAAAPTARSSPETHGPSGERSADPGALSARVRVAIQTKLARYFFYPDLARERGWQGRVLLAFRVQSDGRLDRMHVARSCGYSLLDRAALDALRRVARIDTAALSGRALDVHLPVVYRLED